VPAAIRRAVAMRDGGCQFPGCASVRVVDGELEFRDLRGDRIEAAPPRPPAKPLAVDHIDPWLGCAKNADPGPPDWPYIFDVVSWNLGWGIR
jgi:hypothetical protein